MTINLDYLLRLVAVIALIIATLLFFGLIRDNWYSLPFAWITLAVACWWARSLMGGKPSGQS